MLSLHLSGYTLLYLRYFFVISYMARLIARDIAMMLYVKKNYRDAFS